MNTRKLAMAVALVAISSVGAMLLSAKPAGAVGPAAECCTNTVCSGTTFCVYKLRSQCTLTPSTCSASTCASGVPACQT
jgi:hypothetical protein